MNDKLKLGLAIAAGTTVVVGIGTGLVYLGKKLARKQDDHYRKLATSAIEEALKNNPDLAEKLKRKVKENQTKDAAE